MNEINAVWWTVVGRFGGHNDDDWGGGIGEAEDVAAYGAAASVVADNAVLTRTGENLALEDVSV